MPRLFQVRSSKIHGKGVFATRRIPKGTRLIEYRGERISWEEADRRYDDDIQPHHTFLFAVDDETVIDGGRRGNDARWINHSCDPNCEAVDEDGRIFIETIRDIERGEELTYDYSYILDEPHTAKVKARYPCRCGSPRCRGTILGNKRRFREQLAREERRRKPSSAVRRSPARRRAAQERAARRRPARRRRARGRPARRGPARRRPAPGRPARKRLPRRRPVPANAARRRRVRSVAGRRPARSGASRRSARRRPRPAGGGANLRSPAAASRRPSLSLPPPPQPARAPAPRRAGTAPRTAAGSRTHRPPGPARSAASRAPPRRSGRSWCTPRRSGPRPTRR